MPLVGDENSALQSRTLYENEASSITAPVASSWSEIPSSFNAHHVQHVSDTLDSDDAGYEVHLGNEGESELDPSDFNREGRSKPDLDEFEDENDEYDENDESDDIEESDVSDESDKSDKSDKSDESDHDDGSGSELDLDEEASREYMAADTQIAESLVQIESGDLAAHLYNAQALKRRARLPADQLEGVKDSVGDVQLKIVPNDWTAWPLDAAIVLAPGQGFGPQRSEEEGEEWVIGGLGEQDAEDELREELLAVMLRLEKERNKSRLHESRRSPFLKMKRINLTDDDKARQVLQPTIEIMLRQLDRVAAAISETRLKHSSNRTVGSRSQSRTRSRSLIVSSPPKTRALSRKASISKVHQQPKSQVNARKRPLQQPIDSDSASDYEAGMELRSESSNEPPPKRQRSSQKSPYGLLDWRKVLGVAYMIGWNKRAVDRTAQRCAELFGSGESEGQETSGGSDSEPSI